MGIRRGIIGIAMLCSAGALAMPAAASAEITISDGATGEVVLTGDADPDIESIFTSDDFQAFTVGAGAGTSSYCQESMMFPGLWSCGYAGVTAITVNLGGGIDDAGVGEQDPWPTGVQLSLRGDGGADTLRGGSGDDKIRGGAGKDKLKGLSGSDKLNAKDGQKDLKINCGDGDDPKPKLDPNDPRPHSC